EKSRKDPMLGDIGRSHAGAGRFHIIFRGAVIPARPNPPAGIEAVRHDIEQALIAGEALAAHEVEDVLAVQHEHETKVAIDRNPQSPVPIPASVLEDTRRALSPPVPPCGAGAERLTIRTGPSQDGPVPAPFPGFPMLTIYGRATSSNTQLVMWAIGELDL